MPPKEINFSQPEQLLIPHQQMEDTFFQVLKKVGFHDEQAQSCARIFMENSLDGVYSHGVNRFPRFIEYVQKGYVKTGEKADLGRNKEAVKKRSMPEPAYFFCSNFIQF
jgi:3-dehydro-L-gulonate 2-dehydrogenase